MKKLIVILLFAFQTLYGAQLIEYVDPDAVGANNGNTWADAYTSLAAWEAGEGQDLTDNGGDYMTVYCRSSSGTDDTTEVLINGFVTAAANYIEIIGDDFPVDGILDTSKYVLTITFSNDGSNIEIRNQYIHLKKLQIQSGAINAARVYAVFSSNYDNWSVDSCIIHSINNTSTERHAGIYAYLATGIKIYNTLVYDYYKAGDGDYKGIRTYSSSGSDIMDVYNCTVYGCYRGFSEDSNESLNTTNCISVNNVSDFYSLTNGAINNCLSDDGSGNNPQSPTNGADNWTADFTIPGTDFSLLAGSNAIGNGTDNPGSGLYSDDIIDTARSSTWDIGAFEYVSGEPPAAAPAAAPAQIIICE